ncbi:aminopeptidase [Halobaculum sp. MBLA0147]|uniref:aminopeptidase n=1 Tax=Halobaculum sp. MBLA0147 TaxID=3079934 RepID=UPI00352444B8
MDERVREHAAVIVDHSTDVQPGDDVVIQAGAGTEDLVVALHEELGERNANPVVLNQPGRARRAFALAADPEELVLPDHTAALMEAADVVIGIRGSANQHESADVPPEQQVALQKLRKPVQEAVLDTRWVGTQYPHPGTAQKAEMSTPAYEEFVYDAVTRDWDEQRALQEQMVEILDPAEEVRIVSGSETDLTMSVDGTVTINDYAEHNLPGGEVFTAPVPDSVEGTVLFDKPVITRGREVTDARLTFEDGEVVDFAAGQNEDALAATLEADEGASRLGELGIGMNRDIDRFTYNMLFDEKMGDTVHLALGRAYEDNVPEESDVERNESAIHVDMIVDMSEDSRIEVDGEVVQRDGTFRFEDDFEA